AVVVRVEDVAQRPAPRGELAKDRLDLRRVDRRGRTGVGVVHEESVVVGETRKHVHLNLAHRNLRPSIVPRIARGAAANWLAGRLPSRARAGSAGASAPPAPSSPGDLSYNAPPYPA